MEDSEKTKLRENDKTAKVSPLKFRAVWPVIRAAGLVPWTTMFVILFLAAMLIVDVAEPAMSGLGNTAWLMFQVVTTIGLGDFAPVTLAGRLATVVLSTYSVLFFALITGTFVSYCQERMVAGRDESVAHFIDQLEHLPELSHEELVELSEKVKRLNRKRPRI